MVDNLDAEVVKTLDVKTMTSPTCSALRSPPSLPQRWTRAGQPHRRPGGAGADLWAYDRTNDDGVACFLDKTCDVPSTTSPLSSSTP